MKKKKVEGRGRKRNILVPLVRMRKSGAHVKSLKRLRVAEKVKLRKETVDD